MPGTIPGSPVLEFYNDAKVFITGGTGFVGKALMEKFLRVCTNVEHIYLLIRLKKGKDPQQRMKELFEDKLFDTLRAERPDFEKKVTCIPGDISTVRLGMSDNDYDFLANEVTHVFHSAATVRFNEKLKSALEINVLGTQEIVEFCSKCKHLKILLHVSTAYAHYVPKVIGEEYYDPPMSGKKALSLTQIFDEEKLESLTPELIKPWPNTYSYTKSIAENIVKETANLFPATIFRPGIVMGSFDEPVRGWIDNIYGPTGVIAAVGVGLLRVLYADDSNKANIVPVDLTVNAIISCAWEAGTSYNNSSIIENSLDNLKETGFRESTENLPKIYNFVADPENSITWGEFAKINLGYGKEIPSNRAIWYYTITLTKFKFLYLSLTFLLHFIPAILIDGGLILLRKKPQLVKAYKKIHMFTVMVAVFAINTWKYQNPNVQKLWCRLSEADKKLFRFDMTTLNWSEYFAGVIIGIRNFIFRESDHLLPNAKRKMFFFWLGHRFLQIVFAAFCLWIANKLLSIFLNISNTPINDKILMTSELVRNST